MAAPRKLNKTRQFLAILRKNFILQTRGRRILLGIGGWAGLILQLLLPVSFFLVMYLPKYYIKPIRHGESLGQPPIRIESSSWAAPYDGPATSYTSRGRASLLLTPDTPDVRGLGLVLARTLACPREPRMRICPSFNLPASFHCMFMPPYGVYDTHVRNTSGYGQAADVTVEGMDGMHQGVRQVQYGDGMWASGKKGEIGRWEHGTDDEGFLMAASASASTSTATSAAGDLPYWRIHDTGGGEGGGRMLGSWWSRRLRLRRQQEKRLEGSGDNNGGIDDGGDAAIRQPAASAEHSAGGQPSDACADFATCISNPACYEHVIQNQFTFMPSQEAARHATVTDGKRWDAVVHFPRAAAAAKAAEAAAPAGAVGGQPTAQVGGPAGLLQRHLGQQQQQQEEGVRYGSHAGGIISDGSDVTTASGGAATEQHWSSSELLSDMVVAMNHTDVPPTGLLLDQFDVLPTRGNGMALYRRYWFFANLQLAISRAVIGIHVAANSPPKPPSLWPPPPPFAEPPLQPPPAAPPAVDSAAGSARGPYKQRLVSEIGVEEPFVDSRRLYDASDVRHSPSQRRNWEANEQVAVWADSLYDVAVPANVVVSYKAFPWPAVTEDLGAAVAAVFFQLLLVYAFLPSTRAVVGDIVREKELRLREGMRVLGLSEPSYWLSWGLTHWVLLALSGALCTAAGTYPFANSSPAMMLGFFWLYAAALVSYGYCLSTLFSSSRMAGTVVQFLYALSMLPGFVLPSVYPYGSWTWYAACLSPPSAATLFAAALVNWEKVAEGIRPSTLWTPITQANGFCAATTLWMLALDVVLYGVLTWYLDKVLPKSYGQRLPWWFIFDRRYWASKGSGSGAAAATAAATGSGASGLASWRRWRQLLSFNEARTGLQRSGSGGGDAEDLMTCPLLPAGRSTTEAHGGGGGGGGGICDGSAQSYACGTDVHSVSDPATAAAAPVAVEVHGLVKVFRTLTGESKMAVDHLDLQIDSGRITALLGHNGAGKTTTIHILTGMLQPTAGSATVNGFDVATQMDQVRASLGICPQFDILWPDLTVYEHLEMYGAIKGYQGNEIFEAAVQAATRVDLLSKLQCPAGELSGGQRRKLSVAIAFLGNPAVVFLDEPTSGMDPYSRRFTWEVIRQHRSGAAIVLTTHSMEEADLLGDRVVILAQGRVAAEGTGMELKANYGVGYNLTLVIDPRQQQQSQSHGTAQQLLQPPTAVAVAASYGSARPDDGMPPSTAQSPEAAVMAVVRHHVPAAELLSAAGAEVVIRLPREAAGAFPALLRELDGPVGRQQLGVASYGLSLTTLEEVFLSITAAAEQEAETRAYGVATAAVNGVTSAANGNDSTSTAEPSDAAAGAPPPPARRSTSGVAAAAPPAPPVHPQPLHGWRLYGQQMRALLTKRALCARRDRLAVLTQLAVPLALVYLALWISSLQVREPSQPPLELSRRTALFNRPLVWSASAAARNASEGCNISGGGSCLAALLAGHPAKAGAIDSGATALYAGDPRVRPATLEDYLLRRWYGGSGPVYDALHVTGMPPPATVASPISPSEAAAAAPLSFVLLTNQSAVSALPAALAEAMTAAWSYASDGMPPAPAADAVRHGGGVNATGRRLFSSFFSVVSWPLPLMATEPVAQIEHSAASLMLVLCLVLASSVLSASFVIFIVREQDNNSKHLQLVSGAPATAYWAANYGWDLLSYSLSATGLLVLIVWYKLPQYSGARLGAVAALLGGFGPAGISLTYLLHFLFRDEMCALQRLNTAYFLTGYLGFVATWICDVIEMFVWQPSVLHDWNRAAKWALRTASPHYCFARGMYDVQATYDVASGPRSNPFSWDVFGSPMTHMAIQTLAYGSFVVLYDAGVLTRLYVYGKDAAWIAWQWLRRDKRVQREGQPRSSAAPEIRRRGWWVDGWWRRSGQQQHLNININVGGGGGRDAGVGAVNTAAGDMEEGVPLIASAAAEAHGASRYSLNDDGRRALYQEGFHGDHGRYPLYGGGRAVLDSELVEDEDVMEEKRAVIAGLRNNCQVLLDGVRKSYSQGPFRAAVAAVRGLWVGVPAGECFGLLGVNGAGKTTTFRMVTGEVLPDGGDARVGGFSVRTQLAAARRQLGYCPQFEALPGAMTGHEVVAMYARLRGVPESYVDELASYLLRRLGLEGSARNPCGGYSGGMKRKLGVAVALVGDPRVCALDEPSTGMDPGARRALWTCLQNEVIRAGRTVVLTSHSMEECEALCTRLTILVAGRQRCLGTVQHLKNRFGGGYVLEIKTLPRSTSGTSLEAGVVQPPYSSAHGDRGGAGGGVAGREAPCIQSAASAGSGAGAAATEATLAAWLASVCPGAVLSHVDQNRYTFTIPRALGGGTSPGGPSLDLAALFEAVESRRAELGVVDYCLTQTTLEQLFVSLAGAAAAATRNEEGPPGF